MLNSLQQWWFSAPARMKKLGDVQGFDSCNFRTMSQRARQLFFTFLYQPEDTLGAATSDRQRSKVDDIWASMNATDPTLPGGASSSRPTGGKGKGKGAKKKKANKKANKVKKPDYAWHRFCSLRTNKGRRFCVWQAG